MCISKMKNSNREGGTKQCAIYKIRLYEDITLKCTEDNKTQM